jgi:hypothetical protein
MIPHGQDRHRFCGNLYLNAVSTLFLQLDDLRLIKGETTLSERALPSCSAFDESFSRALIGQQTSSNVLFRN